MCPRAQKASGNASVPNCDLLRRHTGGQFNGCTICGGETIRHFAVGRRTFG